jgi:hypothetical protein
MRKEMADFLKVNALRYGIAREEAQLLWGECADKHISSMNNLLKTWTRAEMHSSVVHTNSHKLIVAEDSIHEKECLPTP